MRRRPILASLALLATLILTLAPTANAAGQFPAGWEGYHTYAETGTFLSDATATFGQGSNPIIRRVVIGRSYEGRDIWAVKISDRVGRDEKEPEALAVCGMHGREILAVEMCLYMVQLLTQNYGQGTPLGQRVTNLVNTREIWIVPNVNPDGSEFNIGGGTFHNWRKNRQPTPGTTAVGIDLNRNWDHMWGCCAGSSGKPKSIVYRGRFPFEAVENRVLRDFILGRRVDGLQQIKAVFNWHSYDERVMWPYGYTMEDVPPTMTADDHEALVAIGRRMGDLNGYRAHQGSDLYIYDGDFPGWVYGNQRIFVYTLEMYPRPECTNCGGFKPRDDVIVRETTRNTEAVLYFLEQADCPYRAAGLLTRCGPINDDFETARGWTVDAFGTDDATDGAWERGVPAGSSDGAGLKQRSNVPSGQADMVTGREAGNDAGANDVDGGTTSVRSRAFKLGSGQWTLRFDYTFAHDATATGADFLRISVLNGGVRTPVWSEIGSATNRDASWTTQTVDLSGWRGKTIRLLIEATDGAGDNIVEAAIDDLRVHKP